MRQVHCDGCGFAELSETPRKNRKVKDVSIEVVNDPRFPEGTGKFKADLCPGCLNLLLSQYFNVPTEDRFVLDVPSFLIPEDLKLEVDV